MFHRKHAPAQLRQAADPAATARKVFLLLAVAILPIMVAASFDFGVTWDEKSRHRYGENILEYFKGIRPRAMFDEDGGSPYGGLFDFLCAFLEQWIPMERYSLRHALNAVFGWIGVVYAGRLAARLFGTWTGVLAMVLLASLPRYFGDSMNNPKDLPFAAMTVAALYYFSTISPRWPYFSWSTAAKIAAVLALGLNIRAGALIYLGYFGLLVIGYAIAERNWEPRRLTDTAGRLAVVSLATMLLGTVFWPWAQGAPLTRPIEALIGFANYDWSAAVLYRGRNLLATDLPWDYAPWWILISTPPVVLAGAALSIAAFRKPGWAKPAAALWAIVLFPVVMVIARGSTLYDGIRHLLFVFPPLVILAAAGWNAVVSWPTRPLLGTAAAALLAVGVAEVFAFDVRYHPNQIVYFNGLVGGPHGALARYELDYWGNCMLQAVEWSARAAREAGMAVSVSGNPWALVQLDAERFRELRFVQQHHPHELNIRLNRGSSDGVAELAARQDALYRVETPDGALLCAVMPGPNFARLQGRLPPELLSHHRP
jgi:hypothetical protein